MAAITLTKIDARPTGTLGGTKAVVVNPSEAWYQAGAIADADTTTFANWQGPIPQNVWVKPSVTGEAASAEWALSAGALVITYRTDGAITSGASVGIEL
jgi:hypothetical protein